MRLTSTGLLQVHTSLILADDRISSQMGPRRWRATVGLAGRESTGWFFGFKLHLVFNHQREIVALKLTPGNLSDTGPVPDLTKELISKLFGGKGYIGKDLAQERLRRGLALMTRVRRNMKA